MTDFQAIGQVLTTSVLMGGLLWGAVKFLLLKNEARHILTEKHVDERIDLSERRMTESLTALHRELAEHVADDAKLHDVATSERKEIKRDVGFLQQRTAGLEAAVFKRPPLLDEDINP